MIEWKISGKLSCVDKRCGRLDKVDSSKYCLVKVGQSSQSMARVCLIFLDFLLSRWQYLIKTRDPSTFSFLHNYYNFRI